MRAIAKDKTGSLLLIHVGAGVVVAADLSGNQWCNVPEAADKMVASGDWGPVSLAENDELAPRIRRLLDNQQARVQNMNLHPPALHLSMSYDAKRQLVAAALRQKLGLPLSGYGPCSVGGMDFWDRDMNDESIIYSIGGRTFKRDYELRPDASVVLADESEEVMQGWIPLDGGDEYGEESDLHSTADQIARLVLLGNPFRGDGGRFGSEGDSGSSGGPSEASRLAVVEKAAGVEFHPDTAKTIGNRTSFVKRADAGVAAKIDEELPKQGFTKHAGRSKNETVYGKPGTVVSVKKQGTGARKSILIETIVDGAGAKK